MRHGDFSLLADDYSKYRPDYAPIILKSVIGLIDKSLKEIDAADIGAGTGIWTRMLDGYEFKSIKAVEPNDQMRLAGEKFSKSKKISWLKGSGENTGLPSNSVDMLSMASSFHWADFEKSIQEFNRVLRPGGIFVSIWNPRFIKNDPMLVEIEKYLTTLKGSKIKRVSSGVMDFTDNLTQRLDECGKFKEVVYMEAMHKIIFSKERYIGAWRSVNDLRVQLGEEKFSSFLNWVEDRISKVKNIPALYQNRAWIAKKKN